MREQRIESVMVDAEEALELFNSFAGNRRGDRFRVAYRRNHHLGLVSRPFEKQRAQPIRGPFRHALRHDPVFQDGRQRGRPTKLRPHFLVATGRDNDQLRAQLDAATDCVIRGRIAGVQRDQRIHRR